MSGARRKPLVAHGSVVRRVDGLALCAVSEIAAGSRRSAELQARGMAAWERMYLIVLDSLYTPSLVTPERLRACLDGVEGPVRDTGGARARAGEGCERGAVMMTEREMAELRRSLVEDGDGEVYSMEPVSGGCWVRDREIPGGYLVLSGTWEVA